MNLTMVAGIVVAACGVLIVGMAALIKTMVLSRLNEIQDLVTGLSRDMHRMDIRLTKIEAEHSLAFHCRKEDR